jgi:threonine dehydratase
VRDLVDDIVLVSEAEIAGAIRHAYWEERQIVEGSGAVGIAALKAGRIANPGITAVVVSGGNIDMDLHYRIVGGEDVDVTEA